MANLITKMNIQIPDKLRIPIYTALITTMVFWGGQGLFSNHKGKVRTLETNPNYSSAQHYNQQSRR